MHLTTGTFAQTRPIAFALASCGVLLLACTALEAPKSRSSTPALAPSEVRLTFFGSVAFVPTSPSQTPMSTGSAKSVLVLLPRAYSAEKLSQLPIPDRSEFDPLNAKHGEHHLILKIPAENLGGVGSNDVVIPVRPPTEEQVYEISVTGLGEGTDGVQYSRFESVATVQGGTGPLKASEEAIASGAALARMHLGKGWTLTPVDPVSGRWAHVRCARGMGCSPQLSPGKHEFARGVQALSPRPIEQVAVEVRSASETVLRLPLRAKSDGSPIAIKVIHAPYSEMFGGPPNEEAMHHFKLFYLLADTISRPYFYPHLAHGRSGPAATEMGLGDPFCTPLAQFVAN